MKKTVAKVILFYALLCVCFLIAGVILEGCSLYVQKEIESSTEKIQKISEASDYSSKITEYNQDYNEQEVKSTELASASILLRAYGFQDASIESFLDNNCITFSEDNWTDNYCGDSNLNGWCSATALMEFTNKYIDLYDTENTYYAQADYGNAKEVFTEYLNNNIPVVVWVTQNYDLPQWDTLNIGDNVLAHYTNQYCVVAYKKQAGVIYLMDPFGGQKQISVYDFETIFDACGGQYMRIKVNK